MAQTTTPPGANPTLSIPEKIFAVASPKSLGGVSMFDAQAQIRAHNVANFLSVRTSHTGRCGGCRTLDLTYCR
jgi:hypothetical protein